MNKMFSSSEIFYVISHVFKPARIIVFIRVFLPGIFTLFAFQVINADGNKQASPIMTPENEIVLHTWVLLEGSAIDLEGNMTYSLPMRSTLNFLQLLPGQYYSSPLTGPVYNPPGQPYTSSPWNYKGNEGSGHGSQGKLTYPEGIYPTTVVDWILVSIRTATDGVPVCTKSALLHKDGHVEMVDGEFDCEDLTDSAYYIVIEHRNHLLVMSDSLVPLIDGALTYDFRYTESYIDHNARNGFGQKELIPGLPGTYAMYTGNGDQTSTSWADTDINFNDGEYWGTANGTQGQYCNGDFNMNGDCNLNDQIIWDSNNGVFSTVPND